MPDKGTRNWNPRAEGKHQTPKPTPRIGPNGTPRQPNRKRTRRGRVIK